MTDPSATDRLLLVNDDPAATRNLRGQLERAGFHVTPVSSGTEALEQIVPSEPDLILLDVAMPGLDGYTTCEIIKTDPRLHWLPVIMLGEAAHSDVALLCLDAGANDFVLAPYTDEELVTKVRTAIKKSRAGALQLESQERLEARVAADDELRLRLARETAFADELNDRADLEGKAAVIREHLADVLGVASFSVFAFDPASQSLRVVAHNSPRLKNLAGFPLVPGTVMAEAIRSGKPVFIEDFSSSRFSRPAAERPYGRNSCITVPLRIEQRVIGVVNLNDKILGEFAHDDVQDAARICALMASALQNAFHHQSAYEEGVRDRATGLYNRRYVDEHLPRLLKMAKRSATGVTCVMLAIDPAEPRAGAGAGPGDPAACEPLLRDLGTFLLRVLRETDIVARYEAERLLLVLPGTPSEPGATLAERLQQQIAQQDFGPALTPVRATVSLGIASYPEHGWEARELLAAATAALEGVRGRSGRAVAPFAFPVRPHRPGAPPEGLAREQS